MQKVLILISKEFFNYYTRWRKKILSVSVWVDFLHSSPSFWSDIWSNVVIEQSLMRPFKFIGGLTHGRGITENFIFTMDYIPSMYTEVTRAVKNFSGVSSKTSKHHAEEILSRKFRDSKVQKILYPFKIQTHLQCYFHKLCR